MKEEKEFTTTVQRKIWGPDDTYLIAPANIQLHDPAWKEGQPIKIKIIVESV